MRLSPLARRRWQRFRANRRGWWSLWIFLGLLLLTLPAEFLANDRPLLLSYQGRLFYPVFVDYAETEFGGFLPETDYRDGSIQREIEAHGWMLWPPIRYGARTINRDPPGAVPSPPSGENWLGTDEQARDVLARVIYGFRLSVLFGLALTVLAALIGIAAGAVQGWFGGWGGIL